MSTCDWESDTRTACYPTHVKGCIKPKVMDTRVFIWKLVYFQTAAKIIRVTVFSDSPTFLFIPLSSYICMTPRIVIFAGQDHWCPFKATDSCGGVGHTHSTLNTWNSHNKESIWIKDLNAESFEKSILMALIRYCNYKFWWPCVGSLGVSNKYVKITLLVYLMTWFQIIVYIYYIHTFINALCIGHIILACLGSITFFPLYLAASGEILLSTWACF